MQMRFFNQLGDIKRRYEDLEFHLSDAEYGHMFLATWGIRKDDPDKAEKLALIRKEHAAITYLFNCKLEIAHDTDAIKPDMSILESALNRHLAYIDRAHGCNQDTWRGHRFKSVSKQYEACNHYLFKMSLPAWVEKLPASIPTFENKYPDFNKKLNIPQ